MSRLPLGAVMLAMLVAGPEVLGDSVMRRGAEPAVTGEVIASGIDDAGLQVRSGSGAVHFVPWDHIREVRIDPGDDADHRRNEIDRRMPTAIALWRARSRLQRDDFALAEPLFERLFEQYRGRTHETALLVAEGLLRCRLARGANVTAVIPAVEVARLRRAGVTGRTYAALVGVLDEQTSLCPQLPPAWVHSRALMRLERELAAFDAQGDEIVAAIAHLYRCAVCRQLGTAPDADPPARRSSDHPGVRILTVVVDCGVVDADARRAARQRLERVLDSGELPVWAEGWARFTIGVSLLGEPGVGPQQRGMVHLLHLPARFARRQPYLAGLALAWVVEGLHRQGDHDAAAALASELADRFPHHPLHRVSQPVAVPTHQDS